MHFSPSYYDDETICNQLIDKCESSVTEEILGENQNGYAEIVARYC